MFSVVLFAYLLMIGIFFVMVKDFKLQINDISEIKNASYYVARLVECPITKEKSVKVMMELVAVKTDSNSILNIDSKIIAYF